MIWRGVVAALAPGEAFRSRVSPYLHPLAGRPMIWHVVRALLESRPAPEAVQILHRADVPLAVPSDPAIEIQVRGVVAGEENVALRGAVSTADMVMLVDGAAPLITPPTVARLLRASDRGVVALESRPGEPTVAIAGEGLALASAEDPRTPGEPARIAPSTPEELERITDRSSFARAASALRDRLVRWHESNGVTFVLPSTTWLEVDVRIGADTVVYPGVVLEGATTIQEECVIGPHCRIVDSTVGRGVELKGYNYVTHTSIRNQAVIEPHVRRGYD